MSAATELFIYYRIDRADEAAALVQVQQFQAGLTARFAGLQARLLVRDDTAQAPGPASERTFMETYAVDRTTRPAAFALDDCRQAIAAAAEVLAPLLRSPRHLEVFRPCD